MEVRAPRRGLGDKGGVLDRGCCGVRRGGCLLSRKRT